MRLPTTEEIDAELARRSLAEFVKQAWSIIEPAAALEWTWHIPAICDHLQAVTEGRIRRLLVNIPPGHIKSLLTCVFWPAWVWLERPWRRSIYTSYALPLALRDSRRTRRLIGDDWYQRTLHTISRAKGEKPWVVISPDTETLFENSAGGFRSCGSVKSGVTGHRGHDIVCDDPIKAEDTYSEAEVERVIRWWSKTMPTRLISPIEGTRTVIMQRLGELDLSGYILSSVKVDPYDHVCLPSEYPGPHYCVCPEGTRCSQRDGTSIGFTDPRTEPGELLNPAYFPAEAIESLKESLDDAYAGQHQQTPSPPSGVEFQLTWMKNRWHALPSGQAEWLISWDLRNGGQSKRSSFAVGQVWMRPGREPGKFLLVDQIRGRWEYDEEEAQFIELCRKWPQALTKLVENKADGRILIMRLKTQIPGLVAIDPGSKDKVSRARATLPLWKAGNVWLPNDAPWVSDFVSEHAAFPRAANDDQVDTTTQALNYWIPTVGLGRVDASGGYESAGRRRSAGMREMF